MLWRDDDEPDTAYLDDDLGGMAVVTYGLLGLCFVVALVTPLVVLVARALRIG